MGSARTPYAGNIVVDIEAGAVDAADVKAAGLVAEKFYDAREKSRIDADLADYVLDRDYARTRASRDRDRAFPRSEADPNERKRRRLPSAGEFRATLSSRQRKARSSSKRKVVDAAPRAQIAATQGLLHDDRWAAVNAALSQASGNAQKLAGPDRALVQRVDRLIQRYESETDRGHVVYVAVELPADTSPTEQRSVPATLQPGARISFDQFTMASHTMSEAAAAVRRSRQRSDDSEAAVVILEIETSRGLYLGRSDSVDDTSHLLPRGLPLQVSGIDPHADYSTEGGHDSALVVQLIDSRRPQDYTPPVAGRRRIADGNARAAAAAAAREKGPRHGQINT